MSNWRVASASCVGTSHAADESVCQDAHIVDFVDDTAGGRHLLIAVADGAGSARLSHIGSQSACSGAILALKNDASALASLESACDAIRRSFEEACSNIEDVAQSHGVGLREMATTLIVAVISPMHWTYGQVGDGAVVVDRGDDLELAHWPEQEALNLTDFLCIDQLDDSLRLDSCTGVIEGVACMTDGLTPLALNYRERQPHEPLFRRLFTACADAPDPASLDEDLRRFLDSAPVNERTDDDKTLVVAVRAADDQS